MKKTLSPLFLLLMMVACNSNGKPETEENTATHEHKATTPENAYSVEMVVNNKDYACGMPTSAGINDTCHYEGKAYGFCSKECKDEFLKSPEKYLAQSK